MLDATVLEAVRKWRYKPHYKYGTPVEVETKIVVEVFYRNTVVPYSPVHVISEW